MSRAGVLVALAALLGGAAPKVAAQSAAELAVAGARASRAEPSPDLRALAARYVRERTAPVPAANALTPARVALGRMLFFDPRLSGSGLLSCASCHNPALGWQDGLPLGLGHNMARLGRHTPTILNVAWDEALMWDGRFGSLEEQALGPIASEAEMRLPLDSLVARLRAIPGYAPHFEAAYPGEGISVEVVGKALASFERTIVSADAPFDRWVAGDETAMDAAAVRGFALFNGKARCAQCHAGWRFTDGGFYDIGLRGDDEGRGAIIPGVRILGHAFKAPTLRNIAQRAPYMHDGSEPTLEAVIDFYDRGGDVRRPSLSPEIRPLGLTAPEKRDLVAFLHALTSDDPPVTVPRLPR